MHDLTVVWCGFVHACSCPCLQVFAYKVPISPRKNEMLAGQLECANQ